MDSLFENVWNDQLVSYGGSSITYDAIGNPLTYGSYTYTRTNGRQLESIYKVSPYVSATFRYNDEGIRTEKIYNGIKHEYSVSGGQINREVIYSSNGQYIAKDLRYYYDAAGHPAAIRAFTRTSSTAEFTSNIYYLLTNMQGDVIAIYNEAGQKIYEYAYDAWGNMLRSAQISTGGSAANQVNPFRYRGYYYDTETGLYYLQSRYYNPKWGRFLNADGYVSTGTGLLGYNMYAYCNNNPVNRVDPTGTFWKELWGCFVQTLQQSSGYFAVAAGISQADTPAPGPADAISAILLVGGLLFCAGTAVIYTINAHPIDREEEKAGEKEIVIPANSDTKVYIYRYGGTNPGNLTPSQRDVDLYSTTKKGLSFSTIPKPGAAVTTIEDLNATGIVYAVQDGATHVSVFPVGGTLEDWHNAGSTSIWTVAVKSAVMKWDGGN